MAKRLYQARYGYRPKYEANAVGQPCEVSKVSRTQPEQMQLLRRARILRIRPGEDSANSRPFSPDVVYARRSIPAMCLLV
jgi:hypothetical protein